MIAELAGFVIPNQERDVLVCRYEVGDFMLYEAPTVTVTPGRDIDRGCVQDLSRQMGLQVSVREKLATTVIDTIQKVNYECTWLLADLHNDDLRQNRSDSDWHYVTVGDLRRGYKAPGPHTEKLLWAITNEVIRIK